MIDDQFETWLQEDMTFPELNDILYSILFGQTAEEMRKVRGVKMFEPLRDHFTIDELRKIGMTEAEITCRINAHPGKISKEWLHSIASECARQFRNAIFV